MHDAHQEIGLRRKVGVKQRNQLPFGVPQADLERTRLIAGALGSVPIFQRVTLRPKPGDHPLQNPLSLIVGIVKNLNLE